MKLHSVSRWITAIILALAASHAPADDVNSKAGGELDAARKEAETRIIEILKKHDQALKDLEKQAAEAKAQAEVYKDLKLDQGKLEKIEKMRTELEATKKSLEGLKTELEQLRKEAAKKDAQPDQVKERISAQAQKAETIRNSIASYRPDDFKFVSDLKASVKAVTGGRQLEISLDIMDGSKRVPLPYRKVMVFKQYKDGPLESAESIVGKSEIVLDMHGRAAIKLAKSKASERKDIRLVVKFDGDATAREVRADDRW